MDDSTFEVLEKFLDPSGNLEYWHDDTSNWRKGSPPTKQIRVPGLVHEASTMWMTSLHLWIWIIDFVVLKMCISLVVLSGLLVLLGLP